MGERSIDARARARTLLALAFAAALATTAFVTPALGQSAGAQDTPPPSSPADSPIYQTPANRIVPAPGLVVGGSYSVPVGTTVQGDLSAVGATVSVPAGAALDGHLIAVGGTTAIDGEVSGDVHAYGGTLTLGARSRVGGDVSTDYATFQQAGGAIVGGSIREGTQGPVRFSLPEYVRTPVVAAGRAAVPSRPGDMLVRAIGIGLLGMLVMALVPARVTRVREAMVRAPWRMGLDGLLTGFVATLLLVLLAVTLIGIPLSIVGGMLLYAAVLFGWIAFGDAIGEYLAGAFQQHWGGALRVGIGSFALAFAVAILTYIPVLGGLLALLLSLVALGAVRATRAGGRERGGRRPRGPEAAAS